jgi:hypothetical protein
VRKLGLEEAFARFGAKLVNRMWAVSAYAEDGAFVVSGWSHLFKATGTGALAYVESLSRWNGKAGNDLLRARLEQAKLRRPWLAE